MITLITNFNAAEVSVLYAPFYVLFEKVVIGIILIYPAIYSLKLIYQKEG